MSTDNMLEVILVKPMQEAKVITIDSDLKSLQSTVGGYIELVRPFEEDADVTVLCNEEGKINGEALNRAIYNKDGDMVDIIAGTFFICYAPADSEEFQPLPSALKEKYLEKFKYPEDFYRTINGIKAIKLKPIEPKKGKGYER